MTKTVLVVEDNPDARELLLIILAAEGFSVITAADGQAALNIVRQRTPDLILTDIQMPKIDGIQLIHRIREEFQTLVPIVVMTAFDSATAKDALEAGANHSTTKPMDCKSLVELVKQILK